MGAFVRSGKSSVSRIKAIAMDLRLKLGVKRGVFAIRNLLMLTQCGELPFRPRNGKGGTCALQSRLFSKLVAESSG